MTLLQRDLHQQLRTEAAELHSRVADIARGLDPEQLVRRPAPGSWSVAEVLEHLCVSDEVFAKPLATLIHRAHRDAGAPMREWKPSFLGKMICGVLENPKPRKAPRPFRIGPTPRGGVAEDFLTRNARLQHRMDDSASLDWVGLRLPHPALPLPVITFNLGDVFKIHVVHVRRHLGQIERAAMQVS